MALFREPEEIVLDQDALLQGMDKLREEVRRRDLTILQQNEEIARLKAELQQVRSEARAVLR